MNANKKKLIAIAVIIPAIICGVWFWQKSRHQHHHEKLTGETSFDVYADGNNVHLLLLNEHGNVQTIVYRQYNSGKTAAEVILPNAANERIISKQSNNIQIAAHGKHILAAWQIAGTGFMHRGPLRIAQSQDGGKTWQLAQPPTGGQRTDDQGFSDLLADDSGQFHLVWLDSQGKIKGLRYAVFINGKWSDPQTIDAETCQCCWNKLARSSAGGVFALYRNARPRDMALATLRHGTWQKSGIVDGFNWQVEICPHAGGGLAADGQDLFATTWTGKASALGSYLMRKKLTARVWSKPMQFGNSSARNPDIAVGTTDLAVAWDEFKGEHRHVLAAVIAKNNLPKKFTAKPLSQAMYAGSYPRVVQSNGVFYAFWFEVLHGESQVQWRQL